MNEIQKAIEFARQNPDSTYASELRRRIESGQLDKELSQAGLSERFNRPSQPSFGDRVRETAQDFAQIGQGIVRSSANRAENISEIQEKTKEGEKSRLASTFQTAGQLAGAGADAIGETFKGAVKMVLSPRSEERLREAIGRFGQQITEMPLVQKAIETYENLPEEEKDNVDALGGFLALGSEFVGAGTAQRAGRQAVTTGARVARQAGKVAGETAQRAGKAAEAVFEVGGKILPKSPEIMNRVARLTAGDQRKFQSLFGESHGEYLTRTGNFQSPEKIVETEAKKFVDSIKSVDDTLAQIDGVYKAGVVDDVFEMLNKKIAETSTANVPSPIKNRVDELFAKYTNEGLTQLEINELKRIFERNVKLGYSKINNPSMVETATNVDNALRKWQQGIAEEAGFENIKDLNRQTQQSRFIVDSLGKQISGQSGNNMVGLTDSIILSNLDPTAISAFLTKRVFSNKNIQAKLAKWLSDVKPEKIIKPRIKDAKPK